MTRRKIEFTNREGHTLTGALEQPDTGPVRVMALFAHCFTCGKDVVAATRIASALADQGIAVFRFDFTGLGGSDGDFGNTNFSSNVDDLLDAAEFLTEHYQAPRLLIGHSLGGAAALVAASRLESVEAVVTIAAPSTPSHVQHLFADQHCDITRDGQAEVDIGGRHFNIRSQLLEDLEDWSSRNLVATLRKPLLIFHSPVDAVVPVSEAAELYQAAMHPKSFVSLDNADHLLSKRADADYVAATLAAWASRYLEFGDEATPTDRPRVAEDEVIVTEQDARFLRGLYTTRHEVLADEPESKGGTDQGPTPYDLLLMSLGACTSMTLRLYANHKSLAVSDIQVRLRHSRIHAEDCQDCESKSGQIEQLERHISYKGNLTEAEQQRFLEIADRCPVHKTLTREIRIRTEGGQEE
ncbi:bifunctional alpha/beta hydrolase/OsmC family protein [Saccharospirillum alexandrii]|uniref:bifunctional alpha/beta hydrolase/OsmC family protein n=1 Tax=Saccharospirillum alexandrii TaxID=2448477 RepID=UPI000FD9EC90|nr:bifunctional alpha/beta hydrolase/OsmC family protein [Saccharospirillum alexandrii]